jgi:hypothetical protein
VLLDPFSQATPSQPPRSYLMKLALTRALPKTLPAPTQAQPRTPPVLLSIIARATLSKLLTLRVLTQTMPRTLPVPMPTQPRTLQAPRKILAKAISNKPPMLPALTPILQRTLPALIQALLKTLPAPTPTQPRTLPAPFKTPARATSNKPPTWPPMLWALLRRLHLVRVGLLELWIQPISEI